MTDFIELSKDRTRIQATTIDVELSGRTLYLSKVALTVDGNSYESIVAEIEDLSFSARDAGTVDVDFGFSVSNKKLSFQAKGERFGDLFVDYDFVGCKITLKQHLQDTDGTWKSRVLLIGQIENMKMKPGRITFSASSSGSWNKPFPPSLFRKEDTGMANLPDATIGVPIPVIYGEWWNTPRIDNCRPETIEVVGINRNAVPILLCDTKDATAGFQRYRVCSHKIHTAQDPDADGVFLYERDINMMCSLELGLHSIENTDDYVDIRLASTPYAEAYARPISVQCGDLDANLSIDGDEVTYVDWSYNEGQFPLYKMEPCSDLGQIIEMRVNAICRVIQASNVHLYIGYYSNFPTESEWSPFVADSVWSDVTYIYRAIGQATMRTWNILDLGGGPLMFGIKFGDGATSGIVRIHEACVWFKYRPKGLKGIPENVQRSGKRRTERRMW